MWKECTSYVNHRTVYLDLGRLQYLNVSERIWSFSIPDTLLSPATRSAVQRGTQELSLPPVPVL